MKLIQSFDPTASLSGQFDPLIANSCGRILLFNESPIGLQLNFIDGSVQNLPPYYSRSYMITKPGLVSWSMLYSINFATSPLSVVIGEAYESVEAKGITFSEGPLNRQTNVANTVSTAGGSVASLLNAGNPAGTVFVSSEVAGDANLAVSITNDAQVSLGDAVNAANVIITGAQSVSGNFVSSGFASMFDMNVFGLLHMIAENIELDNAQQISWFDTAAVLRQVLTLSNTNKVILSGMNQFLEIRDQSGAVQFSFDVINDVLQFPQGSFSLTGPSGLAILTTSLANTYINGSNSSNLTVGGTTVLEALFNSIICSQRLVLAGNGGMTSTSFFSGTGTTTGVAHGCKAAGGAAAVPDFIAISCIAAGSTMTTGYSALTTTTCTITCGSSLAWKAVAFKF
jgi:hypothetical protein